MPPGGTIPPRRPPCSVFVAIPGNVIGCSGPDTDGLAICGGEFVPSPGFMLANIHAERSSIARKILPAVVCRLNCPSSCTFFSRQKSQPQTTNTIPVRHSNILVQNHETISYLT
jgi:hypothetical protein